MPGIPADDGFSPAPSPAAVDISPRDDAVMMMMMMMILWYR
jgi:hypothetical protein